MPIDPTGNAELVAALRRAALAIAEALVVADGRTPPPPVTVRPGTNGAYWIARWRERGKPRSRGLGHKSKRSPRQIRAECRRIEVEVNARLLKAKTESLSRANRNRMVPDA